VLIVILVVVSNITIFPFFFKIIKLVPLVCYNLMQMAFFSVVEAHCLFLCFFFTKRKIAEKKEEMEPKSHKK